MSILPSASLPDLETAGAEDDPTPEPALQPTPAYAFDQRLTC